MTFALQGPRKSSSLSNSSSERGCAVIAAAAPETTRRVDGSENMTLMREMGAESYYPMPASQHAYMLDIDEPALNRAIAWVWSKTIRPRAQGKKRGWKRTAWAVAERGDLTAKHLAGELGWKLSNGSAVLTKLEE